MTAIAHVVSTFAPEHGGPTHEIGNHCEAQVALGHRVSLYTLYGFSGAAGSREMPDGIKHKKYRVWWPSSLGFSGGLVRALVMDERPDLYHIHGVWHLVQTAACIVANVRKTPSIYHLMGGFTAYELNRKAVKKRLARLLYQDRSFRMADCLHVNGESEAAFLRELGFSRPIVVLPVGTHIPNRGSSPGDVRTDLGGRKVLLYLARLHPTKGVDLLLDVWHSQSRNFREWVLVIGGTGASDYVAALKSRAAEMVANGSVVFTGLLSEDEKQKWYECAQVYILPSFQENFGNTVVEALAYGVPVLTTTRTRWAELESRRCGWLFEPNGDALGQALARVLSKTSGDLAGMGRRGIELVHEKYSLQAVVEDLDAVYSWLRGGPKPEKLFFKS
jgi:glycosyltransferase involved in cell wall biosynthesis